MTDQTPSPQSIVVPVEPTEAMIHAGASLPGPHGTAVTEAIYRAMLAAAPAPSSLAGGALMADLAVLATCDDMEVSHRDGDTNVGDVARRCLAALSPEAPAELIDCAACDGFGLARTESLTRPIGNCLNCNGAGLIEAPAEGAGERELIDWFRQFIDRYVEETNGPDSEALIACLDRVRDSYRQHALRVRSSAPEARDLVAIQRDQWVSCSPEWLKTHPNGCAEAPRVACKTWDGHSHYHPVNWPAAPSADKLRIAEKAVMTCPQCEGEGEYADGVDDAACSTPCTRCDGNGWLVDFAALTPRHEAPAEGAGEAVRVVPDTSVEGCYRLETVSQAEVAAMVAAEKRVTAAITTSHEGVVGRGVEGAILDELWPILGGNHTPAETWNEISDAVDRALRARSSAPEARGGEAVAWFGDKNYEPTEAMIDAGLHHNHRSNSEANMISSFKEMMMQAEIDGLVSYTHPAAPSADKLRVAVDGIEAARRQINDGQAEAAHYNLGTTLAALKAEAKS